MFGLRIEHPLALTTILSPMQYLLDQCWWYLGGAGVSLPNPEGIKQPPPLTNSSPEGLKQWQIENSEWLLAREEQEKQYSQWIESTSDYRVGLPGWYLRYADYLDTDWAIYFACNSNENQLPRAALDRLHKKSLEGMDWFSNPSSWFLPHDVVAMCRIVDDAYWEIFFSSQNYRTAVQNYLRSIPNAVSKIID